MKMSRELVESLLSKYMLKGDNGKAKKIANWLSNNKLFKTHSRRISREQLEESGLKIQRLEDNQKEQDLFLSVFHATTHTFTGSLAIKIIENHQGKAFVKSVQPPPVFVQKKPKSS